MNEYHYPTDEEIEKLVNLANNFSTKDELESLISFIREIWWMPEWGFSRKGRRLELHTGGWSGNEQIIGALENSYPNKLSTMFFMCFWRATSAGGHYYFELPGKHYWKGDEK